MQALDQLSQDKSRINLGLSAVTHNILASLEQREDMPLVPSHTVTPRSLFWESRQSSCRQSVWSCTLSLMKTSDTAQTLQSRYENALARIHKANELNRSPSTMNRLWREFFKIEDEAKMKGAA
jgi:hypothetical protein